MTDSAFAKIPQDTLDAAIEHTNHLVTACIKRDTAALHPVLTTMVDTHGIMGTYALSFAMATSFCALSGLTKISENLPQGVSAGVNIEVRTIALIHDGDYPRRHALAVEFIAASLADLDNEMLGLIESDTDNAVFYGLCEMIAGITP